MPCLDDRETQMEAKAIFVNCVKKYVLQVGSNSNTVMFYSDYQNTRAAVRPSQRPLLLLLRTASHVLLPSNTSISNSILM